MSFGKHFMHRGTGEAAAQHSVRLGMAERHFVQRMRVRGRLDALDAAAQTRKRVDACAGHAPFLNKLGHCRF